MTSAPSPSAEPAETGPLSASETRVSRATWAFGALVAIQLALIPAVVLDVASDARQVLVLAVTAFIGVAGVLYGNRGASAAETARSIRSPGRRGELPARLAASPADTDHLTGLLSREGLVAEAAAGRLVDSAVIVLDVARMRAINTRFGHEQGDRLLRALAGRLVATLRPDDLVARWGGDGFAICLPSADLADARAVLARIEHGLAAYPIAPPGGDPLSVCAGAARITEAGGAPLAAAIRDCEEEIHNIKNAGPARRAV